jgi:hypothetical protein
MRRQHEANSVFRNYHRFQASDSSGEPRPCTSMISFSVSFSGRLLPDRPVPVDALQRRPLGAVRQRAVTITQGCRIRGSPGVCTERCCSCKAEEGLQCTPSAIGLDRRQSWRCGYRWRASRNGGSSHLTIGGDRCCIRRSRVPPKTIIAEQQELLILKSAHASMRPR